MWLLSSCQNLTFDSLLPSATVYKELWFCETRKTIFTKQSKTHRGQSFLNVVYFVFVLQTKVKLFTTPSFFSPHLFLNYINWRLYLAEKLSCSFCQTRYKIYVVEPFMTDLFLNLVVESTLRQNISVSVKSYSLTQNLSPSLIIILNYRLL